MVFNSETEEALEQLDDGMENDIEEQNGLPYSTKSVKEAYFLQLDQKMSTNNAILVEAQNRVERREQQFGEGCSLSEPMHTGTGLDLDDGEELLDDSAEYKDIDQMNIGLSSQININNRILTVAEERINARKHQLRLQDFLNKPLPSAHYEAVDQSTENLASMVEDAQADYSDELTDDIQEKDYQDSELEQAFAQKKAKKEAKKAAKIEAKKVEPPKPWVDKNGHYPFLMGQSE